MSVHDDNPPPRLRQAPRHIPIVTFDTAARRAQHPPYRAECTCGQWETHSRSLHAADWAHHTTHAHPGTAHLVRLNGRAA